MLFRQKTLVFGLQIEPVFHREFKLLAGLFQDFQRFSIRDSHESALSHEFEPLVDAFIDEFCEQAQVLGAVLQRVTGHGFDELLAKVHITCEIAEGHLRLDHPELSGMAGGVRVLRAEGGAESIDIRQRAGKSLYLKLSANGQVSGFAEEISGGLFINVPLECRDAKHFAGAFAIAGGNNRRMHVNEIALLKKFVYR